MTSGYLSIPVIRKTKLFKLQAHFFYIIPGPDIRMYSVLYSCVFGRKAKRVPSHGMQDVISVHLFKPCHHVSYRVISYMPHMELSRRIREHLEAVIFFLGLIFFGVEAVVFLPIFLPFLFYLFETVSFIHF